MKTRVKVIRFLIITVLVLLTIICVVHWINKGIESYWLTLFNNIVIGIFGSAVVSIAIYYKEYRDAKRETLIQFFNKVKSILIRLNDYKYGDTKFVHVNTNIEVLKDITGNKVSELSTIYGDIEFLWDKNNCHEYIGSIYKIFVDLSLLICREIQFMEMGGHDIDTLRSIDCILQSINSNVLTIHYYLDNMVSIINGHKISGKFKIQSLDIGRLTFVEQDEDTEEAIKRIIEWYKNSPSFMLDLISELSNYDEYKQKYIDELPDWYAKHPSGTFSISDIQITQKQLDRLYKHGYLSLMDADRYYINDQLLSYFKLKSMQTSFHEIERDSNTGENINMSNIKLELISHIK